MFFMGIGFILISCASTASNFSFSTISFFFMGRTHLGIILLAKVKPYKNNIPVEG